MPRAVHFPQIRQVPTRWAFISIGLTLAVVVPLSVVAFASDPPPPHKIEFNVTELPGGSWVTRAIAVGDVTGDGNDDIIVGNVN